MLVIELQSSYHLSHDCDISFRQPDRVRRGGSDDRIIWRRFSSQVCRAGIGKPVAAWACLNGCETEKTVTTNHQIEGAQRPVHSDATKGRLRRTPFRKLNVRKAGQSRRHPRSVHHLGQLTVSGIRGAFQTSRCPAVPNWRLPSRASAASTIHGLGPESPPTLRRWRAALNMENSAGTVWRSGRDSNPRYAFGVYSLSRRAPSTTRPPLRMLWTGARPSLRSGLVQARAQRGRSCGVQKCQPRWRPTKISAAAPRIEAKQPPRWNPSP